MRALIQALIRTLMLLTCTVGNVGFARAEPASCPPAGEGSVAGAYAAHDTAVVSVLPEREAGRYRITHFQTGRSHRLVPVGPLESQSSAGLDAEAPVVFRYRFADLSGVSPARLSIQGPSGPPVEATRVRLVERAAVFQSGDVELRGRLTLPPAGGQRSKAVVFVHGSDPVSSVGHEWLPHLLASHGVATLVFDKRGTGCSGGQYVQHFGALSKDVVAAVDWLARQPEVDPEQIGLVGFSQGGWVAPLAALKDSRVRFVAIGFGLATSMAEEDQEEAPLKLLAHGISAESVEEFKALNAELHQLARAGFNDWRRFEEALARAKSRPWFEVAARQQSWLGLTVQMGLEKAKVDAPRMFQTFFQPFYDPVPTLESLRVPMLWLMGGQDIEAPPQRTIQILGRLHERGQPIRVVVFPDADHGIQEFDVRDGVRVHTRYSEGFFRTLLAWVLNPA